VLGGERGLIQIMSRETNSVESSRARFGVMIFAFGMKSARIGTADRPRSIYFLELL
jgi:hypothetical protein